VSQDTQHCPKGLCVLCKDGNDITCAEEGQVGVRARALRELETVGNSRPGIGKGS
jgi:histone acetyltransferase (RNA polymerase elongator complex component)